MYLKLPAGEGKFTVIPLTGENVYSICPICGEEYQVDLDELITIPATKHLTVHRSRIEMTKYIPEHVRRNRRTTLRNGGGRGVDTDTMKFFCKRTAVRANQKMDDFFNGQLAGTQASIVAKCA